MARDLIHKTVRQALENEGWVVTKDPYPIKVGGFEMEIDLAAENLFVAERGLEKIAVEIKSFAGVSQVYDFHLAVGQFVDYRIALREKEPDRVLYIGIVDDVWEGIFSLPFAQMVIREMAIKVIVVNQDQITVSKWIK
jgi:hypothetical protein